MTHQRQMKTRSSYGRGVCFRPSWALAALSVIVVIVIVVTAVVWAKDLIRLTLHTNMGLENNTLSYNLWVKPPILPLVSVYVFNYTNADEFEKGIDTRLQVEELGPYVYRQRTEKVNVVFNHNGTVSYQEKVSLSFVPELSARHHPRQDYIAVPNIPLLSALSVLKDSYVLAQLAFLAMTAGMDMQQFVRISVHDFFWGYDDALFSLARTYTSLTQELPYKKFGILMKRNGITRNRMTMYTGKQNLQQRGVMSRLNGEERLHHWLGDECNRIDGTDGSMFPPNLVKRNSTIYIFNEDACRRFPLEYVEDITVHDGIPGLRFRAPRDLFAKPDVNPQNACYCRFEMGFCPPSGVFDASPCTYGAPIMMSFPHFYLGDPILLETVEGLKPDPEKHDGYLDVHEELGVPLDGKSRFQMNILVRKSKTLQHLANFKDGSILPIAWFEVGIDGLPEEIMDMLYHLTFTTRHIQFAVRYMLLVLSAVLVYVLVRRIRCRPPADDVSDTGVVTPI